jgi:Rrf2 family nitric oxide-sensitive transcriptional repressor
MSWLGFIKVNHLFSKVAARLANAGYIISTRGKGGGIGLAKHPHAIGIGDLIRKTDVNYESG